MNGGGAGSLSVLRTWASGQECDAEVLASGVPGGCRPRGLPVEARESLEESYENLKTGGQILTIRGERGLQYVRVTKNICIQPKQEVLLMTRA